MISFNITIRIERRLREKSLRECGRVIVSQVIFVVIIRLINWGIIVTLGESG